MCNLCKEKIKPLQVQLLITFILFVKSLVCLFPMVHGIQITTKRSNNRWTIYSCRSAAHWFEKKNGWTTVNKTK